MDTPGWNSVFFIKGDNLSDFLFALLYINRRLKRVTLGANSFVSGVDRFSEGRQINLTMLVSL